MVIICIRLSVFLLKELVAQLVASLALFLAAITYYVSSSHLIISGGTCNGRIT